METQKFTRKPVAIEAVQVSPTNYEEVAAWCKGTATLANYRLMGETHEMGAVLLGKQGPKNDQVYTVLIGQWITKHHKTFRTWSKKQFEATFDAYSEPFIKGQAVRVIAETPGGDFVGWEGIVDYPRLCSVDFGGRGGVVFEHGNDLQRIDSVSSEQQALNNAPAPNLMEKMLDQMRSDSREQLEKMEARNLEQPINLLDRVRILPKKPYNIEEYWNKVGTVTKIDDGMYTVEFKNDISEFVLEGIEKVQPPKVGDFVKVDRELDSEYNGQGGHVVEIEGQSYRVAFATDLDQDEFVWFHRDDLVKVDQTEKAENLVEQEPVTINQLREEIGLPVLPMLGDKPADPRAVEHLRSMNPEERESFVRVQKVSEEVLNIAVEEKTVGEMLELPGTNDFAEMTRAIEKIFSINDMVEVIKEGHERYGQSARVTVLGVELIEGKAGVEVLYSDGEYDSFNPDELKKI